jgi:TolB protein
VAGLGKPGEAQTVRHADWRGRGADALLVGQVTPMADGRLDIRFRLFDVVRERQLAGFSYVAPVNMIRAVGHKIADIVHEKLLGEPGSFSGRLAYILKKAGRYELQVSDVDGHNAFTIANSPEPIISPAWSPSGNKLAYVSFEQKKPVIYVQNLADGKRHALANFRGSNSAPAWSPDGSKLAIVLSKDETSQIYLIDVDGGGLKRVSRGGALETEPVFSPDGKWLYFTSDRGGSPQIYKIPVAGGEAQRLTFGGGYNVSPAVSPDGSKLAYVQGDGNRFQVAVLDLATSQTQILTDSRNDESPSFAPNGRTILYATLVNGRGVLATVSVDGRIRQRLSQTGDLREPSWAP